MPDAVYALAFLIGLVLLLRFLLPLAETEQDLVEPLGGDWQEPR